MILNSQGCVESEPVPGKWLSVWWQMEKKLENLQQCFLACKKQKIPPFSTENPKLITQLSPHSSYFFCRFRTATDPKTTSSGVMLGKHGQVCHMPKTWHWLLSTNPLSSRVPWLLCANLGRWAEHWTKPVNSSSAVALQGYSKLDYKIFLKPEFSFHLKLSWVSNVLPLLSKKMINRSSYNI